MMGSTSSAVRDTSHRGGSTALIYQSLHAGRVPLTWPGGDRPGRDPLDWTGVGRVCARAAATDTAIGVLHYVPCREPPARRPRCRSLMSPLMMVVASTALLLPRSSRLSR